jgi:hypothetical protein
MRDSLLGLCMALHLGLDAKSDVPQGHKPRLWLFSSPSSGSLSRTVIYSIYDYDNYDHLALPFLLIRSNEQVTGCPTTLKVVQTCTRLALESRLSIATPLT